VLHAAYKGVVSPENSLSQSGCGKVTSSKKWHFALKTGIGGESSKGSAASCKKQLAGVGQSAEAQMSGGFTIAMNLGRISASATTIDANVSASWSASFTASDGGHTACDSGIETILENITEWEWNSFSNDAYNESIDENGIWYNYTYNTASIPSPFNLNNTTYYYHDYYFEEFGDCEAYGDSFLEAYGYLIDTTTGSEMYQSSNSLGTNGIMFDTFTEVYNETDYYCENYSEWDEGSSYSLPYTCYSYNTTLTSEIYSYYPTFSSSIGSNNTVSWTNSSASVGDIVFNGPFSATDHYALELEVYGDAYAYNSWQHGSANFVFNMATAGHQFKLNKVTIS
jgi:hypothetical protein